MSDDGFRPAFLWPRYIEKKWVQRTLAHYNPATNSIILENGTCIEATTPLSFIIACFENNLLTFINDFRDFPYLDECLQRGAYVPCTELGRPIAIRLKGTRGTTRWIVNAASWQEDLSSRKGEMLEEYQARMVAWLQKMRQMYQYLGVGTQSTPGAEGQALMRKCWKDEYGDEWREHRHQRPPNIACHQIRETSTGARSDTIDTINQFETAWEIDAKNAYGSAMDRLPTGYTYRVYPGDGQEDGYETYFCRCLVTIHQPLKYGPFPIRTTSDFGKSIPSYPDKPGTYETHLWREEVELARSRGCSVEVCEGWAWEEWTTEFQPFVEMMTRLRDEAPNEWTAQRVKHALVAAIGRFGMPPGLNVLVSADQADPETDLPLAINGLAYDWFIKWIPDKAPTTMPHWFFFILMKCRLSLFHVAEQYAISEQLIATNTDAVIVGPDADVSPYRDRTESGIQTGQWRKRLLHEVVVPAPRHLESLEKTVTPGVPKDLRKKRYKPRE